MEWIQTITIIGFITTIIIWMTNKLDGDIKALSARLDGDIKALSARLDGVSSRLDGHANRMDQLYCIIIELLKKENK